MTNPTSKRRYEIINPSDQCWIEAGDEMLACVVALLLGSGNYGLDGENGEKVMPPFLLGGFDEWWSEKSPGVEFGCYVDASLPKLLPVFESFKYARERTSVNDIGARAAGFAANIRKKLHKAKPRQTPKNLSFACVPSSAARRVVCSATRKRGLRVCGVN